MTSGKSDLMEPFRIMLEMRGEYNGMWRERIFSCKPVVSVEVDNIRPEGRTAKGCFEH